MTAGLLRSQATPITRTQNTITAAITTATPTTTPDPLPAMDRNMANPAWNVLERPPDSERPLPAGTAESERFVTQRAIGSLRVGPFHFPVFW